MKILKTVFNPPHLNHTIQREELLRKIEFNKDKKLIFLKAGPGYGKTILAASFYSSCDTRIWISIPKGYLSFFEILCHLAYALDQRLNLPKSRELTATCQMLSPEDLIVEIINLIAENIEDDLYIFFDDFHHLLLPEENIDKIIELFISFIPSNVHIVITSHNDLPFPVAKLRVTSNIYQLDSADFNFDLNEIKDLFIKNKIKYTSPDLHTVFRITNGWIAVITLLINEFKHRGADWVNILNDPGFSVADFISQAIHNLSSDLRTFLTDISIFDLIDVAICDKYLARNDSQGFLNRLYALKFVHKHDDQSFVLHQLIKDRLIKEIDLELLPEKFSRLADIYLADGNNKDAVFYLCKSGKIEQALKMILEITEDMVRDVILMEHWLELVPESYFESTPELYLYRGQIKERISKYDQSLEDYHKARNLFAQRSNQDGVTSINIQIAGIYWFKRDFSTTVEMCRKILPEVKQDDYQSLSRVHNLLGLSLIELVNREEGVTHLKQALEYCGLTGDRNQEAWILNNLCFMYYIPNGNFDKAVEDYTKALDIFTEESSSGGRSKVLSNMSSLYIMMHQIDQVRALLDEAEKINIEMKNELGLASTLILRSRYYALTNNTGKAIEDLERLPENMQLNEFYSTQLYLSYCYLYIALNDLEQALIWIDKAINVTSFSNHHLYLEFFIQKMKIKFLSEKYAEALSLTEEVSDQAERWGYKYYLIEALFYQIVISKKLETKATIDLKEFVRMVKTKKLYFIFKKHSFLTKEVLPQLKKLFKDSVEVKTLLVDVDGDAKSKTSKNQKQSYSPRRILDIRMFGEFSIYNGKEYLNTEDWKNKKALNLLKFLVLNRNRLVLQDQILEVFWPELDFEKARQNLYVALYYIRKMLEPGLGNVKNSHYIISQHGSYKFNTNQPYRLDIEDFENYYYEANQLMETGYLKEAESYYIKAKNLYKEDILPENLYDDWCIDQRRDYQNVYINLLQRLLQLNLDKDKPKSLEFGLEILRVEPFLENINATVLKLYVELGNSKEAINHYQRLKVIYMSELDAEIPDKLVKLFKSLIKVEQKA